MITSHAPLPRRAVADVSTGRIKPLWKASLDDPNETAAFARLVERAVKSLRARRVLDVGCGAAMPTLAAAQAGAQRALGIDIVPRNVFIARGNIRQARLEGRVSAHYASWESVVRGDFYPGEVDLVVANPPYVPSGDGTAVDGGPTGTRMLDAIIDGTPQSVKGLALLFSSLSDPLHVLARLEQRAFTITGLFGQSVPFGRYTSAPCTLSALLRLRSRGSAWFCDAVPKTTLAPYQYLTMGVIAQRDGSPRAGRAMPFDEIRRLLDTYRHEGPTALADFPFLHTL